MLDWLYTPIAWALEEWHGLFSTFLDPAGGTAWTLAIVSLVVTVRLLLLPLVVSQVRSQRNVQSLQPEIDRLRAEHGPDTQAFSAAVLALQRERGVSPLAGCLPGLLQAPVFLALLHVLRRIGPGKEALYSWSADLTQQAAVAKIAGAPLAGSWVMPEPMRSLLLDQAAASGTAVRVVALVLILAMCATSFLIQKTAQRRAAAVGGAPARVQRVLLHGIPLGVFATGFLFPVGVLLHWTTSNLWTLGQQLVMSRRLPPAEPPAGVAAVAPDPR